MNIDMAKLERDYDHSQDVTVNVETIFELTEEDDGFTEECVGSYVLVNGDVKIPAYIVTSDCEIFGPVVLVVPSLKKAKCYHDGQDMLQRLVDLGFRVFYDHLPEFEVTVYYEPASVSAESHGVFW